MEWASERVPLVSLEQIRKVRVSAGLGPRFRLLDPKLWGPNHHALLRTDHQNC